MESDQPIRVGVVGFGVIGKATAKAVTKIKDMELVAIFSKRDPAKLQNSMAKVYPTKDVADFVGKIDVMICCDSFGTGLQDVAPMVAKYFHTVDSHPLRGDPPTPEEVEAEKQLRLEELQRLAKDLAERNARRDAEAGLEPIEKSADTNQNQPAEETTEVYGMTLPAFVKEPVFQPVYLPFEKYFEKLDAAARSAKHVSLCAIGWEPGFMSLIRTVSEGFFPKSKLWTFWGRGISMQWSNAAKAFDGVLDAAVYQVPKEEPLMAVLNNEPVWDDSRKALHHLDVYIVAEDRVDHDQLRERILNMPGWFKDYDTHVTFVGPDEMREFHSRRTHAGLVISRGSTSQGINEQIKMEVDMDDNAEFTAYVLASAARAAFRGGEHSWAGAFTMMEVPMAWFNPGSAAALRQRISHS
ncbi:diaminopimelate dehydrogenase [Mobiluncus mulieris]|uniref:diaminopimelate dehydrogenase n=1 Tax=Mobiluncus mulieris TaxID=2052 RepID=UPI000CBA8110|nr:diaminopimelate dehydrogenase [Mobiluncus mulieris]PNL42777.1 diaminopimelate dehydrogenase [Mobiluncus mulieris]